jgi:septal ring factor EnvC (AmiA/AmiB activator)
LFQVPKNDPRNRSHSVHSTDELDERRKEEADFKKIVYDMFKELETERKDQRKKLNDLERYIIEIKSESAQLLEIIKELRDNKKGDVDDKHALSGKADPKTKN